MMTEKVYKIIEEYWDSSNDTHWETPDDIPSIPGLKDELWDRVVYPGIIRRGGIPKESMKKNHVYLGSCRNATEALWDGTEFRYRRYKFGWFIDTIEHFEDNPDTDIFIPIKDYGEASKDDDRLRR